MKLPRKPLRSLLTTVLTIAASAANANTVVVSVMPDGAAVHSTCRADSPPISCNASLLEAVELLSNSAWQERLGAGVNAVRLQLPNSVMRISKPLQLQWMSEAKRPVPLEVLGAAGTVLSGAWPVNGWNPVNPDTADPRIPANVRGKLRVASVAALPLPFDRKPLARGYGIDPTPVITELISGGVVQPQASWPNIGWSTLSTSGLAGDKRSFAVSRPGALWQQEPDLVAHAFWKYDWAAQAYPVTAADQDGRRMVLAGTGSPYGIEAGQRVRIENALSELDSPGEWYLDRERRLVYFYPPDRSGGLESVELTVSAGLLQIKDSQGVSVRNVRFMNSRGDGILIRSSKQVELSGIELANISGRALRIVASELSGIRKCSIHDVGQGGVSMDGGERRTLTPGSNFVEDCDFTRFSRLIFTTGYGVEMRGVGQRVLNSTFTDAPHSAVFFTGNDHTIKGNTIRRVVTATSDAGAIYIGRDYTSRGTIIKGNLLTDIQPYAPGGDVKGVYLDDQTCGIGVVDNIFARVQQPVFLGGGRDNEVVGNLFYQSSPIIHLDARGIEGQAQASLDPRGTLQKGLLAVPYREEPYRSRYPHLASIRDDDFGQPKYNRFSDNIAILSSGPSVAKAAQSGIAISGNRELTEQAFERAMPAERRMSAADFSIKPAARLGSQQ